MNLFFLIVFGSYFILMLVLIIGWQETFVRRAATEGVQHFYKRLSVVIPFRNEEKFIEAIIWDLLNQQYIAGHIEVILVDDHSTDRSSHIVRQLITGRPDYHLLSLPPDRTGKKHAIAMGVERASGEIILTTDADCQLGSGWLTGVDASFNDPVTQLVFGGVRIEDDRKFFSKLQALEFCSLIGSGAATATLGFPTMCNGANLAFRKSAFVEVQGYEGNYAIPSGDDEFLMRKIERRYPGSIRFLAEQSAVVSTVAMATQKEFIDQRLRWAGKWPFNTSRISQGLAVFVLVFQASFLIIWFAPLLDWIDWRFALLLVSIKMISEFGFLYLVSSFLKVKWEVIHFFVLQFFYPLYVVYIGLASFFQSYEWKGRKSQ